MIPFFSGIIKRFIFWSVILAVGWYCGDRYGAPDRITKHVDVVVDRAVAYLGPKIKGYIDDLRGTDLEELDDQLEEHLEERSTQLNAAISDPWAENSRAALAPLLKMSICESEVSNAPLSDVDRQIIDFRPMARVNGVELRVAPLEEGCLSSGFGRRGVLQKMHRGLDYYSNATRTEIIAPAKGVIVEAGYHDDYGIQLLLDHGRGVFSRLAHMETLHSGVKLGRTIAAGVPVGLMGNSGKYTTSRHLHYEILVGDYNTPSKSHGLKAVDPFSGKVLAAINVNSDELR